jgi:putative SOS response-associated peptidase YedK
MPAILPRERHGAWLEGPAAEAFALIGPYPAEAMRIVRIGEGEKADPAPMR